MSAKQVPDFIALRGDPFRKTIRERFLPVVSY